MKKTIVLIIAALLVMSSIASAGFWDRITGKATATRDYSITLCTDAAASYISGDFSFLSEMEYLVVDHRYNLAHRTDSRGIVYITWGSMLPMNQIIVLYAKDKYKGTTMFDNFKVGDNKLLTYGGDTTEGLTIKVNRIYNPRNPLSTVPVEARCADMVVSKQVDVADVTITATMPAATVTAQPSVAVAVKKPGLIAGLFKKKVAKIPVAAPAEEGIATTEETC
ncbi:MAG: hypothetical protein QME12_07880, partial [Nanoarchaeota archaeon]|nr:hypothetical protein [Nanoarchaeota archaeon]